VSGANSNNSLKPRWSSLTLTPTYTGFNYESGVLPSHAAALQIGFGKGTNGSRRDYGKVYRHKIIIDHNYNYPFEHTQMPFPTLRKKETTKGE